MLLKIFNEISWDYNDDKLQPLFDKLKQYLNRDLKPFEISYLNKLNVKP